MNYSFKYPRLIKPTSIWKRCAYIDFSSHSLLWAVQVYVVVVAYLVSRLGSVYYLIISLFPQRRRWLGGLIRVHLEAACARALASHISARDIWAREIKPQQYLYCPTIRILVHIRIRPENFVGTSQA